MVGSHVVNILNPNEYYKFFKKDKLKNIFNNFQ